MTHRPIIVSTAVLLIAALFAADASAQIDGDSPQSKNYQNYSRYFILRADPKSFRIDNTLLQATLSDELIKRAVEASNTSVNRNKLGNFKFGITGNLGGFSGNAAAASFLQFTCPEDVPLEERKAIWNSVLKELEKSWNKAQIDVAEIQSQQTKEQLKQLETKLHNAEVELAAFRDRYVAIQVSTGTPVDQIRNVLQNMIDDRRQMEMKLIGLEAEREAISNRVEELLHASQKAGEEGEIVQELKQILQLRMEALDRGMQLFKTGQMSETEVGELREAIAAAKVEYLKARNAQRAAAGGDEINDLNRHLAEMSRNVMMNKAMLEGMQKQRDELRAALEQGIRSRLEQEQVERELQLRSQMVQKLSEQRTQLESQRGDENITPVTLTPWGE